MDYYSRYLEIVHMTSTTSEQVIGKLQNLFARWGIPEEIFSDNGPQFSSADFQEFGRSMDFDAPHATSSPHYPQSNGEAERGVRITKKILKQDDVFLALMSYRATPIAATGMSPCQLMMGRQIRTTLPTIAAKLEPRQPDLEVVRAADKKVKSAYERAFTKRHGAKSLPELLPGDNVQVKLDGEKGWKTPARVLQADTAPRSYIVQTPSGTLRRNRRYLLFVSRPDKTEGKTLDLSMFDNDESADPVTPTSVEKSTPTVEQQQPPVENISPPMPEAQGKQTDVIRTRSGRAVKKPVRYYDEYC
ncbi:uncharacterized protein [Ptychodera flava]|uniref:uncharacterized protein n=1 Tax=Ptychodera flava TaxID=63121 RepID=UPI00396A5654